MPPPKPKVPDKLAAEFSDELGKLASELSSSLDKRSVPLAEGAYDTVKAAGVFARTVDTKTPDIKPENLTDFSVGMDELLQGFKPPQQVEGGGLIDRANDYTPDNMFPIYTKNQTTNNNITQALKMQNSRQTDDAIIDSIVNKTPMVHAAPTKEPLDDNNNAYSNLRFTENIPAVIPPLAIGGAAAIALTSKPAQAADTKQQPIIPPLLKRPPEEPKKIQQSAIPQEIQGISFAGEAPTNIPNTYELQKNALHIRAIENSKAYEAKTGKPMSELDKSMMEHMLGLVEGSGYVKLESLGLLGHDYVKKFHAEVINPIMKNMQGYNKQQYGPVLNIIRDKAPSTAVLLETGLYYHFGETGWNIGEKGADTNPETLDPIVQKLIQDKSTFIGSEFGGAALSMIHGYRDLPMWLIGGSSKLGLAVGGMANEFVREDGDLARGAAIGVTFGTVLQKAIQSGVAKKFGNVISEKLDDIKWDMTSHADKVEYVANALRNKYSVEPFAIFTNNIATKLADDAAAKADAATTDAFRTQVIAPQAILVDVTADGAPKVFGVKDGRYGELAEGIKNPDGRPVIITQQAKRVWIDNETLRDTYQRLIGTKYPAQRSHGIDEWTPDVLPPDNPGLIFAWKNAADKGGMIEVYRAGSHEFNADLLRARTLCKVDYAGPDGKVTTGLGFYSPSGVVIAPDPSENIPGAIPHDLVFMRKAMNKNVPVNPIEPSRQAWEVSPITDNDTLYNIVDHIQGTNDLNIKADGFKARGGNFPDNVPANPPAAPFDNVQGVQTRNDRIGTGMAGVMLAGGLSDLSPEALGFAFFAIASKREIAKQIMRIKPVAKAAEYLLPSTTYGEAFKIDAAIQAFSTRHFKRFIPDLTKQLSEEFGVVAGPAKAQLSADIRAYVQGTRNAPPPQLAPHIQVKVNEYTNERNADFALIQQLGGEIPSILSADVNPKLESLFARDYMEPTAWIEHLSKTRKVSDAEGSLINLTKGSAIGKLAREQNPELFGKQSIEFEMANDYFIRKSKLNTLNLCAELAQNPEASSPAYNAALGHTREVNFMDSGLLTGKYVSEETYNAIHTFPKEQDMVKNAWLNMIDKVKYNKTVLNPTTWAKNVMGNVYGVSMSNIVPAYSMAWKMPHGIRVMSKDLAAYETDLMSNSPQVQRVKETLKFGLLGAEFESTRSKLGSLLQTLETKGPKSWDERIADVYFKAKDNTLTAMGNAYSKIDMGTKYALYVNGLERWGVDLKTNKIVDAKGMAKAVDLLGDQVLRMTYVEATEAVKRAVVRRIHLSLPMVDRASPAVTTLSKFAGLTNPWLRTGLELARVTSQMPYRFINEPGYALNVAKTGGFLGLLYVMNKVIRVANGISDKAVDDAHTIAPKNVTDYMPGPVATPFRASDGGIMVVDMGDMLIESLQWFTGDNSGKDKNGIPKRIMVKLLDTIFSGGVADNEAKAVLSTIGLAKEKPTYTVADWKKDDPTRGLIDLATRFGPQFLNNGWNLYNTTKLPTGMAMKGVEKLNQPPDIQLLKTFGLDVASIGTEKQKEYKMMALNAKRKELMSQLRSAARQVEGSSTGAFQQTFNRDEVQAKIIAELKKLDLEQEELMKAKSITERDNSKKIRLLK